MTSSNSNVSEINAIIFDLGGVLLNVDYSLTEKAFIDLGLIDIEKIYSQSQQSGLFDSFEIGEINADQFISELQNQFEKPPGSQQITDAWNAMILDFPIDRLRILTELKTKVELYLISNTNEIHYKRFNDLFGKSFTEPFSSYFDGDYYSHLLGMRKPNTEVFEFVIDTHGLVPERTLFIDDSVQHIKGASLTGLNAHHLKKGEGVIELLRRTNILA